MREVQQTKFTIIREDRAQDPKTIIGEGLRIGRLAEADVWLNHPLVSRLHAGINRVEDDFFLINLSASSPTTLNGRVVPFNEIEAIAHGDEIQIGPFFLRVEEADETFTIRVVLEIGFKVGDREISHLLDTDQKPLESSDSGALRATTGSLGLPGLKKIKSRGAASAELSNALKVFWNKRTREKAGRPSPLHPQAPPRLGKIRFNWTPTRDLIRPWPFAIFIWAAIAVAAFSALAAFAHKNAFAPDTISGPHTRAAFTLTPAIAKEPNRGRCTLCHALGVSISNREKMSANCAACHQTESFVASIIPAHRAAGITCTHCHTEHRGADFRPVGAALASCAKCHDDQNKNVYNGRSVHTPHGGTFGYPVKNGAWLWTGLDAEELAQKPQLESFLKNNRVNSNQAQEWRSAQFHGIHMNRVRVVEGLDGILEEDGAKVLSCSSCHKTGYMGANVDRSYPRTTCGKCHNAQVFTEPSSSQVKVQIPSCASCHMQHVRDPHWAAAVLVPQAVE